MRISFTDEELDELLDILDYMCDPCSDEDVRRHTRMIKKLTRARNNSLASKYSSKKSAIDEASRKKRNQMLSEQSEKILAMYTGREKAGA